SPQIQSLQLVVEGIFSRNDEYACLGAALLERFYQVEPIATGQGDIDQYDIIETEKQLIIRTHKCGGTLTVKPILTEVCRDRIPKRYIILYEQNFHSWKLIILSGPKLFGHRCDVKYGKRSIHDRRSRLRV